MRRSQEDVTLNTTASGVALLAGAAFIAILWAIFAGIGVASPVVAQNLAAISY